MSGGFERAIVEWRSHLGDSAVVTDPDTLADYQLNTSEYSARELLAVLRPSSFEDVQQIIKVARSTGVRLHPISSGRNWGFGSALPVTGPVAVVDLARMSRILDVNEEFRYAVIEPGVTQQRMSDFLRERGGALKLNVTGAGTRTSIVGNVLDRGAGNLGPRSEDLLGLEVVLGNGEVVRTGLWHLHESTNPRHCYPLGVGPDLRGLFVQSNVGIVTKMVLRLHRAVPFVELELEIPEHRLPTVIDVLRLACDDHLVTGNIRMTDGMDANIRFFGRTATPTWKAQVAVLGFRTIRQEAERELLRRLDGLVSRIDSYDTERDTQELRTGEDHFFLDARLNLANGIPSDRSVHAITGGQDDLDRDRDRPGFLCLNVVLSFSGNQVATSSAVVRDTARDLDMPALCSYAKIGPTALSGFFPIYFDRRDAKSIAQAHEFKDELHRRLQAIGIYPMRLDIDSMGQFIARTTDGYWRAVLDIKKALDPMGIISPGRYCLADGN